MYICVSYMYIICKGDIRHIYHDEEVIKNEMMTYGENGPRDMGKRGEKKHIP